MKTLSKQALNCAIRFISERGRPLERALCTHHFTKPCPELVLSELEKYQNEDGGFGHSLEPDFRLPHSSPMATSVGLQILKDLDKLPQAQSMLKAAIRYLEASFQPVRNGWQPTPPTVNDYPHTPWWHFTSQKGKTVVDEHWGNPSAELAGYLFRYRDYVDSLDVDRLLAFAVRHLANKKEFEFHETYCYIRLHNLLPADFACQLEGKICEAIDAHLNPHPETWDTDYLPKPLDFVGLSKHKFNISPDRIDLNLDYFVARLEQNGHILPSWPQEFYTGGLQPARAEWQGILTLQAILILDRYNRLPQ